MNTYAGDNTNQIELERINENAECHACGKIGRPRHLIHFAHLCQHFVALCGTCWRRLKNRLAQKSD